MVFGSVLLLVCFLGFGGSHYKDTNYRLERSGETGIYTRGSISFLSILLSMEHKPCFTEHRCVC